MGFLDNLAISTTSGFIGLALLVIGGFMILAGVGIISIQQVTVRQGRSTWILGVILAAVGLYLFYPELITSSEQAGAATAGSESQADPSSSGTGADDASEDWRVVGFRLPDDGTWTETAPGHFRAVGAQDTFAWSAEEYGGDFELTLDIESPAGDGEAAILLFGNGRGFSEGVLIFTVADGFQQIASNTIYDETARHYLGLKPMTFEGQSHSVRITVAAGKASLYVDGSRIATISLQESTNVTGRIGLLKHWERPEVEYSNIRIRNIAPGE